MGDQDCIFARASDCDLHRLPHGPLPTDWRKSASHRGMPLQKEATLNCPDEQTKTKPDFEKLKEFDTLTILVFLLLSTIRKLNSLFARRESFKLAKLVDIRVNFAPFPTVCQTSLSNSTKLINRVIRKRRRAKRIRKRRKRRISMLKIEPKSRSQKERSRMM